tara:strand:+ start:1569 stop:1901 length:333 start_codon:yes stop_codon:yes gene_type:complete
MHKEDDGLDNIAGLAGNSLGNSTSVQRLTDNEMGTNNEDALCGYLHLFNPSSTTFIKHFFGRIQWKSGVPSSHDVYVSGYCNVTAAIDGAQFDMSSGNIDSGTITLYGIN